MLTCEFTGSGKEAIIYDLCPRELLLYIPLSSIPAETGDPHWIYPYKMLKRIPQTKCHHMLQLCESMKASLQLPNHFPLWQPLRIYPQISGISSSESEGIFTQMQKTPDYMLVKITQFVVLGFHLSWFKLCFIILK